MLGHCQKPCLAVRLMYYYRHHACMHNHANMIVEDEHVLRLDHIYDKSLEHRHMQGEFTYSNLEER